MRDHHHRRFLQALWEIEIHGYFFPGQLHFSLKFQDSFRRAWSGSAATCRQPNQAHKENRREAGAQTANSQQGGDANPVAAIASPGKTAKLRSQNQHRMTCPPRALVHRQPRHLSNAATGVRDVPLQIEPSYVTVGIRTPIARCPLRIDSVAALLPNPDHMSAQYGAAGHQLNRVLRIITLFTHALHS